jgi:hypothetical protein
MFARGCFAMYLIGSYVFYYQMKRLIQLKHDQTFISSDSQNPLLEITSFLNKMSGTTTSTNQQKGKNQPTNPFASLLSNAATAAAAASGQNSQAAMITIEEYDLQENRKLFDSLLRDFLWVMFSYGLRGDYTALILIPFTQIFTKLTHPLSLIHLFRAPATGLYERPFKLGWLSMLMVEQETSLNVTEDNADADSDANSEGKGKNEAEQIKSNSHESKANANLEEETTQEKGKDEVLKQKNKMDKKGKKKTKLKIGKTRKQKQNGEAGESDDSVTSNIDPTEVVITNTEKVSTHDSSSSSLSLSASSPTAVVQEELTETSQSELSTSNVDEIKKVEESVTDDTPILEQTKETESVITSTDDDHERRMKDMDIPIKESPRNIVTNELEIIGEGEVERDDDSPSGFATPSTASNGFDSTTGEDRLDGNIDEECFGTEEEEIPLTPSSEDSVLTESLPEDEEFLTNANDEEEGEEGRNIESENENEETLGFDEEKVPSEDRDTNTEDDATNIEEADNFEEDVGEGEQQQDQNETEEQYDEEMEEGYDEDEQDVMQQEGEEDVEVNDREISDEEQQQQDEEDVEIDEDEAYYEILRREEANAEDGLESDEIVEGDAENDDGSQMMPWHKYSPELLDQIEKELCEDDQYDEENGVEEEEEEEEDEEGDRDREN